MTFQVVQRLGESTMYEFFSKFMSLERYVPYLKEEKPTNLSNYGAYAKMTRSLNHNGNLNLDGNLSL